MVKKFLLFVMLLFSTSCTWAHLYCSLNRVAGQNWKQTFSARDDKYNETLKFDHIIIEITFNSPYWNVRLLREINDQCNKIISTALQEGSSDSFSSVNMYFDDHQFSLSCAVIDSVIGKIKNSDASATRYKKIAKTNKRNKRVSRNLHRRFSRQLSYVWCEE